MITLITGAPGAGKTLYTVSKFLRPLLGKTVTEETDDGPVTYPVVIYTNIRGLLVDHELVDYEKMQTWHEWCRPGMVFVIDECQKLFVRRVNGSKVPDHVHELEEHRGKHSVDFVLITQHPMLIDTHVQNLVGRHLHARRVANLPLNIIYEWDHCSRSLLYKNTIAKQPWKYDKDAYKLYKSARVHTKQPRKIPTLLWVILFALFGGAYLIYSTHSKLSARMSGVPAVSESIDVQAAPVPAVYASSSITAASAPIQPVSALAEPAPVLAGCIAKKDRCDCYTSEGKKVEQEPEMCIDLVINKRFTAPVPIPKTDLLGLTKDQMPEPEPTGPSFGVIEHTQTPIAPRQSIL